MKLFFAAATLAAGLAVAPAASAAVVLVDNFDGEVADDLNWDGDATFFVSSDPGSVDLIGAGGAFDLYPGNGRYLDLDGSTGSGNDPAGEITSFASFGAGNYTLSFRLGGNARGAPAQTTRVTLGDFSVDILLASSDPLALYAFTFNTTGGQLIFTELGPSNQQGNILDDISLANAVPEPATWAMMILGFGAAGSMIRRRRFAIA
jgi:hypothetical protein